MATKKCPHGTSFLHNHNTPINAAEQPDNHGNKIVAIKGVNINSATNDGDDNFANDDENNSSNNDKIADFNSPLSSLHSIVSANDDNDSFYDIHNDVK